jgi:hypothetical protein
MFDEIRFLWALRHLRKGLEEAWNERRKGMTSWKTTLCGALAIFVQATKTLLPADYHQLADAVAGVLTAVGLIFAKDHSSGSDSK